MVSPQRQEKKRKQRRLIIAAIALIFSITWVVVGILSILNIIQTTWSGISSVIFAFLGVVVVVSQWLFPFPPLLVTSTQLELVDVSVIEEPINIPLEKEIALIRNIRIEPSLDVKLDFKLRNIGTHVGFLKRADFIVLDLTTFKPLILRIAMEAVSSANYDILVDSTLKGRIVSTNLSQAILPNEVDRFTITIGDRGPGDSVNPTWYLFKVKLIYNGTNEFLHARLGRTRGSHGGQGSRRGLVSLGKRTVGPTVKNAPTVATPTTVPMAKSALLMR